MKDWLRRIESDGQHVFQYWHLNAGETYGTCGPAWRLLLCAIAEVIVISVIMALCSPYGLSGDRG